MIRDLGQRSGQPWSGFLGTSQVRLSAQLSLNVYSRPIIAKPARGPGSSKPSSSQQQRT